LNPRRAPRFFGRADGPNPLWTPVVDLTGIVALANLAPANLLP
jgi:hypothetical protein